MIKVKIDKPFKLDDTVCCGQIFRFFKQEDSSYDIVIKDRVINVYLKDNYLYASSSNEDDLENVIINYFDLNTDYEKINDFLIKADKKLRPSVEFSSGLKMIRQDSFETIMAYIISANNSVSSIAASLNNIAKNYGKKVIFNDKEYFLFPSYEDLIDVSIGDYRNCKVGFRDKYLYEIVKKINNKELILDEFYELDTKTALEKLMQNSGIGPKVASCILLFSYQKYDVFPIDTWVKKIMKSDYNIEADINL